MIRTNQLLALIAIAAIITSCNKDDVKTSPLTSVTVTNVISGGTTAKLGSNAATISNNGFAQFAMISGNNSIYVYPTSDSAHPYYNQTVQTNNGEIYSLFLGGTTANVDAVWVKDAIPYQRDSTTGVRFVNMSSGNPVDITLSTATTTNQFAGLAYKGVTDFKSFPALSTNGTYTFQIRDAATDTLVTSYNLSTPRFQNTTLVIRGTRPSLAITRVNNY